MGFYFKYMCELGQSVLIRLCQSKPELKNIFAIVFLIDFLKKKNVIITSSNLSGLAELSVF